MNSEDAKKAAEIMSAYADGAELQFRRINSRNIEWSDLVCKPVFDWSHNDYRIKPIPKVIPFTFEDREKFIGKLVRDKSENTSYVGLICECYFNSVSIGNFSESYKSLLLNYVFDNGGEPCGKIQEEE